MSNIKKKKKNIIPCRPPSFSSGQQVFYVFICMWISIVKWEIVKWSLKNKVNVNLILFKVQHWYTVYSKHFSSEGFLHKSLWRKERLPFNGGYCLKNCWERGKGNSSRSAQSITCFLSAQLDLAIIWKKTMLSRCKYIFNVDYIMENLPVSKKACL